jgi:hypothetical protein
MSGGAIQSNFGRGGRSPLDQKKGRATEAVRPKEIHMLNVAERAPKAKLFKKDANQFITVSPEKRAADWLEDQVAKAGGKVTTQIVDLTPALARALLNRNEGNRKCSDAIVTQYARDMRNGAWQFNGEPIIVSADGRLNDGQHRSEAVIAADTTIQAIMVIGVARATRTTLDQGKMRSIGDYLTMEGHSNAAQLGTAASQAWQFSTFGKLATGSQSRPTKSEVMAFIDANPDIAASLTFIQRKGADAAGGRTMLAFCHWAFWQRAKLRRPADDFILALIEGAGLPLGHPILYVRNRLINERGRLRANDKAELIFRAWNAHRTNKTVRSFQISGGKLPELEA